MSNPLYRARCRDLAEECCAIAALCFPSTEMRSFPSTEMRTHYSQMAEHCSPSADTEELCALAYGR